MPSKPVIMKQQHPLEQLGKVKKMEAPPFLLTRINAKIAAQQVEALPPSWKWVSALAFGLMLLLNVVATRMNQQASGRQDSVEVLADGLQMSGTNQLYDE